jgi:hypothetical protein
VNVYAEDGNGDDEVDVIQEAFFLKDNSRESTHGALVSDIYKAKEAAEAGVQQANSGSSQSLEVQGGINLGRSKRKVKGAVAARVDLTQLQQAVEGMVQGLTPLARSMDHLQACPAFVVATDGLALAATYVAYEPVLCGLWSVAKCSAPATSEHHSLAEHRTTGTNHL